MISSHETKLRKLLNLRPDDKPKDHPADKPWPPPLPEGLAAMVDDHEQLTRNHRGGRPGISVEIGWAELITLVACWRRIERLEKSGTAAPPQADTVTAPNSLMALRTKVHKKHPDKDWDKEIMRANREQLEAMLNG
uniref:Uncharacterized protein n=1 Tax=viral metagenome TaxID=1070528 RepID=A0A6M3KEC0_9ZZZZ